MNDVLAVRFGYKDSLWPFDHVAILEDEGTGRIQVTAADGETAFLVGRLDDYDHAPWTRVSPSILVHPAHVRRVDGSLHLPDGWTIPHQEPLAVRRLPAAPDPTIPGTRLRRSDVLFLRVDDGGQAVWVTDHGEVPANCLPYQAAAKHGDLFRAGTTWVNRRRVRALLHASPVRTLVLDNGQAFEYHNVVTWHAILTALDLPLPKARGLSPLHEGLFRLELRDFPRDLLEASADDLKRWFGGRAYFLIASVIWQAVRRRRAGQQTTWGTGERAFWYRPLLPVLARAGHVKATTLAVPRKKIGARYEKDDLYFVYLRVLADLVKRYRLCTFHELGFDDPRPEMRGIGDRRPEVLIMCEKEGLQPIVERLADHFGASWTISRGVPKLQGAEWLARALQPRLVRPLQVVAYVDYDPWGWRMTGILQRQLARFGVPTESVQYVVTPDRFTDEELRQFAYPVKGTGSQAATVERWMARTHGIGNEARGIHADHLLPYERVEKAVQELLR